MAVQDYTKPSTYRTTDGKRTAELDYQRETLTVFEGPRTVTTIPMSFEKLDTISMYELRQIVEAATEAPATEEHVCDEQAERKLYGRYVDNGIADTDGYYAPESFTAWQAHYHREIGHFAKRTQDCTATECHAPDHEKLKLIQHLGMKPRQGGGRRRGVIRNESVCTPCYEARRAARAA
jgi:hypothetical protein